LPSARIAGLATGQTLLYGAGTKSFIPMMLTTGVNIVTAGNVWTCNNWKPNFDNDAIGGAAARCSAASDLRSVVTGHAIPLNDICPRRAEAKAVVDSV
jgi:hypothetical protein